MVSSVAAVVWAKTGYSAQAKELHGDTALPDLWLPLWRHLDDSALVVGKIWDEWLSPNVQRKIALDFDDHIMAKQFVTLLAGIHDVGKASPAFAVQVSDDGFYRRVYPMLVTRMQQAGFDFGDSITLAAERGNYRHENVGQAAWEHWLGGDLAGLDILSRSLQEDILHTSGAIIGGHHGNPPSVKEIQLAKEFPQYSGFQSGLWGQVHQELLDRAWGKWTSNNEDLRQRLLAGPLSQSTQVLVTALVIMADWIASDDFMFPLVSGSVIPQPFTSEQDARRLARGWAKVRLPSKWLPVDASDLSAQEFYQQRFAKCDDEGASFIFNPRPSQEAMLEHARTDPPGLMILEAPMGEGKTEAALAGAETLASRTGATGVFVALPTMATSDAMLSRVHAWLTRLPDQQGKSDYDMWLGTSRWYMNREYGDMFKGNDIARDNPDRIESNIYAHRWINGILKKKKGLLSSFGVGTIDQILLASLQLKHIALRHLGLANKIVIIDEVHAADVYMSTYLERSLMWLGFYDVPVVLLSATLPQTKKTSLSLAYLNGRRISQGKKPLKSIEAPYDSSYPLLTSVYDNKIHLMPVNKSSRRIDVDVQLLADDDQSLINLLQDKLADGGYAVIIRNTVTRVHQTRDLLLKNLGDDVQISVAHAQFMATDRARIDKELVDEFGPDRNEPRTRKRILIATQVVEQSLDVDFDLMITDIAPVDLVLQRMGRLHRHEREGLRAPHVTDPQCYVTGLELDGKVPSFPRGSKMIYGEYLLLRTLATLMHRGATLNSSATVGLPEDIPLLVEEVYSDSTATVPAGWDKKVLEAYAAYVATAQLRQSNAKNFRLGVPSVEQPLNGWVSHGIADFQDGSPSADHAVRDGEQSLEVLVVVKTPMGLCIPQMGQDGEPMLHPIDSPPSDDQAHAISETVMRLPVMMSQGETGKKILKTLDEENDDIAQVWKEKWLLAKRPILVLDQHMCAKVGQFALKYDHRLGLEVEFIQ